MAQLVHPSHPWVARYMSLLPRAPWWLLEPRKDRGGGQSRSRSQAEGPGAEWAHWPGVGLGGPKAQPALLLLDGTSTRKPRADESTCEHVGGALGSRCLLMGPSCFLGSPCSAQEPRGLPGRQGLLSLPRPRPGERLLPLGSSACLASLRSAAAKLEDGAAWADSALLVAGLPLGTRAPLSGEGVRGLTVAVVLVAVESIPSEGDLGSWLMPETGREEPEVTQRAGGQHQSRVRGPRQHAGAQTAGAAPRDRQAKQTEPALQRERAVNPESRQRP